MFKSILNTSYQLELWRVFKPFSEQRYWHNLYILFMIAKKKTMVVKEVKELENSVEEEEEGAFDDSVFEGLDALSND